MSKSVFKKQINYRGEWRDWSVLDTPRPALVLPPPNYHIYSGLQGFLTFDKRDLWTVKKTQKLVGDLAQQSNHAHVTFKQLLDNEQLVRDMLKNNHMRFIFLDLLVTHMINTTTLFNYNCAKILYENIVERTVTIGNSFNRLLNKILRIEFGLTDTSFISEYRAFKDYTLTSVDTLDFDKLTFTVSDSYGQPTINIIETRKPTPVKYTFEPLDWICGDYADDIILFIEYTHLSNKGETIVSDCGHYNSHTETEDFFVYISHIVESVADFIYDDKLQLSDEDIDKYFEIIVSLIYDSALVYTRLTLNLPSILAYDNR